MPQAIKDAELDLSQWLFSVQGKIDELLDYASSSLPMDAVERHGDIEKSIQSADTVGRLLADAESYFSQATAQAMLDVKTNYTELTGDERKIMIKNAVRDVQRLVDGLAVTKRTLDSRIYATMNANRSRL